MNSYQKLTNFNGIRFPKGMPADTVLRYIISPPPPQHFLPCKRNGINIPPKISFGMQKRIREACLMADIDPSSIGLSKEESPLDLYKSLPETVFLPVGKGHELEKFKRQQKIAQNMEKMDQRIAEWKAVIPNSIIVSREKRRKNKSLNLIYLFEIYFIGFLISKSANCSIASCGEIILIIFPLSETFKDQVFGSVKDKFPVPCKYFGC